MILVDLSQIFFSNLMVQLNMKAFNQQVDDGFLRHLVLNSLRSFKGKFGNTHKKMVICVDSHTATNWRKNIFPYYKANRQKNRDKQSPVDWEKVFTTFDNIVKELQDNFPYPVVQIPGAEADDVIGTLVAKYSGSEPILIVSGDKDFIQLQNHPNVSQYDPIHKKDIKELYPKRYLEEHIIRGDAGDGIPNFLSADDVLVTTGKRQTKLYQKKVNEWLNLDINTYGTATMQRNYDRNRQLIDLSYVPKDIQEQIVKEYEKELVRNDTYFTGMQRRSILNYLVENRLQNLMENMQDFYIGEK
jgi:hypothetical protein